jgi:hypothetical protein
MFIRQKNNKSESISVQIIDKFSGKYKVIRTVSSSGDHLPTGFILNA